MFMARKPREEDEGAIHHVFARGNRSATIFVDDGDRHRYLRLLARTVRRQRWDCLSYCLMSNHLHLLIGTPIPNLGVGMQRLHGDYALAFNKRHGYVGHVFQGRYGAVRVKTDEQLVTVVRYIAANPATAALRPRAEDWEWSSAAALGGGPAPSWLAVDRLLSLVSGK
jgi:putative transposase